MMRDHLPATSLDPPRGCRPTSSAPSTSREARVLESRERPPTARANAFSMSGPAKCMTMRIVATSRTRWGCGSRCAQRMGGGGNAWLRCGGKGRIHHDGRPSWADGGGAALGSEFHHLPIRHGGELQAARRPDRADRR